MNAAEFTSRGIERFEAGQLEAARVDFNEALRLDTRIADAFLYRGIMTLQAGFTDGALADFNEAIRLRPDEAIGYHWRGAAHHRRGALPEALADYSAALHLQPGDADVYRSRARVYEATSEFDGAITDFTESLRLVPGHIDIYLERASVLTKTGELEAAFADINAAMRLDPANAAAVYQCGCQHHGVGELEQAIDDLSEAIRLDPSKGECWRERGTVYSDLGETDTALADYAEAIRLAKGDAEAFLKRGSLLLAGERFQDALADLNESIRLQPTWAGTYRTRATCWDCLNNEAVADADRDTALDLELKDEPMTVTRSQLFPMMKEHFAPHGLDEIAITQRQFPGRVRADLQRAIDVLFARMTVHHFSGVRRQHAHARTEMGDMLVRLPYDPPMVGPPQYEEVDIGEEQPVRCLTAGVWLLEDDGQRFAVLLRPSQQGCGNEAAFHIATINDEAGTRLTEKFFRHLEDEVRHAKSYRGKILSLEWAEGYDGQKTGIKVHRLRPVSRDQVILPRRTLELLERNVIGFVKRRARLAEVGLATKKGLLFYGPPGTGKTHTIHYLAGTLEGTTTLLISAEQVGQIGEYMTLARLLQPSMIVIEDADLIARDRTTMTNTIEEVLLNKLLNEMDGLKGDANVLFVLTTNRPETLEAALASRPGRIDQAIEFPFPDADGRGKLVRLYSGGVTLSDDVVAVIVERTEGVSAAFIKELMRRAAQFSLERDDTTDITIADVEGALDELLFRSGSLNRKLLGGGMEPSS